MTRVTARDFRGLVSLDVEWNGILLIGGHNWSGKTSVCTAIAAAASGDLLPFAGVTKAKAELLVRDGAADAVVTITQADGVASVQWPSVERRTEGAFADASLTAVGLESPVDMPLRERAQWAIEMLGASPTEEEFRKALPVPDDLVNEAWGDVVRLGWDGAHAEGKEMGARAKGAWERVAGTRYGSQKAAAWRPEGWRLALEIAEETDLVYKAETLKALTDDVRARGAVQQAEYDRIKAQADRFADLDCSVIQAERTVARVREEVEEARAHRAALGHPASAEDTTPCPHCGQQVLIVGRALKKPNEGDSRAEAANKLRQIAAADGNFDNRDAALRQAQMAELQYRNQLTDARAAKEKLEQMPQDATAIAVSSASLAAQCDAATADVVMLRTWKEARRLHVLIEHRVAIVRQLAEDGLRQAVLVDKLAAFNQEWLALLCSDARWGAVVIQPDLTITYDGRPYSLCSASEQFRARCTIQIAAAEYRHESMLVIDGADILDRAGRNGLFAVLSSIQTPALVGMTILRRDDMPDLDKAGIGRSVWIEAGVPEMPTAQEIAA